jgi:hypothetical protein
MARRFVKAVLVVCLLAGGVARADDALVEYAVGLRVESQHVSFLRRTGQMRPDEYSARQRDLAQQQAALRRQVVGLPPPERGAFWQQVNARFNVVFPPLQQQWNASLPAHPAQPGRAAAAPGSNLAAAPAAPPNARGAPNFSVAPSNLQKHFAEQDAHDAEVTRNGRLVSDELANLVTQAKQITDRSPQSAMAAQPLVQVLFMRVAYCESDDVGRYRLIASPEEIATLDARLKAAKGELRRLAPLVSGNSGGGYSGTAAGGSRAGSSASATGDAQERRRSCLSRCDRFCPGASGSGDEWRRSQDEHDRCLNEIQSCRLGCD